MHARLGELRNIERLQFNKNREATISKLELIINKPIDHAMKYLIIPMLHQ